MDLMDYRRKIIANSPHLKSASGAVATFSDGEDLPLNSLNVNIEPVQSGSGDPSPSNIRPISGWDAVEVHNGNTVVTTISLGQTVYGGTLNPLTGVLTVDRAIVDLGTLTWTYDPTIPRFYTTGLQSKTSPVNNSEAMDGLSTLYKVVSFNDLYVQRKENGSIAVSNNKIVSIINTAYTDAQSFKTAMVGQTLVYPLATPYEIQLTPHQIRSLYGNNTIFADTGNASLEYWAHA